MSHEHLNLKQRIRLEVWVETDMTQKEMADRLGIVPSTVCREYRRAGGRAGYDARRADALARKRRRDGKRETKKLLSNDGIFSYVDEKIRLCWSPEQIIMVGKSWTRNLVQ